MRWRVRARRPFRQVAGYFVFVAGAAALAALIGFGVKEKYFTVRAESAIVWAPLNSIRSPEAGTVEIAPPRDIYRPGDLIGNVRKFDGSIALIESPCECILMDWLVPSGQFVQMGEDIVALISADQPMTIRARLDPQAAQKLAIGNRTEIKVPGSDDVILGQVDRIDFRQDVSAILGSSETIGTPNKVDVIIRPDEPFDLQDLGTIVNVRFP